MKKKLVTRIPAARIKKIMQTDEEVGKIAQAVPLLVSKATELFLQSLCDKTADVTLERGAKTITAFHLKQCIEKFNVFDFLQEIVSKVPDMGHGTGGDRHGARRRKAHEEDKESDDELKRPKVVDSCRGRGRGRGRSRGRGRGRGRGSKSSTRTVAVEEKYEEDLDLSPEHSDTQVTTPEERTENNAEAHQSKENVGSDNTIFARGFDLNLDLDENGDIAMMQQNVKHEEQYLSSSHSDGDDVIMQPLQLQMHFSRTIDQDEDDYDNDDV